MKINEAEQKAANPEASNGFEVYDVDWDNEDEIQYLEDIQAYIFGG